MSSRSIGLLKDRDVAVKHESEAQTTGAGADDRCVHSSTSCLSWTQFTLQRRWPIFVPSGAGFETRRTNVLSVSSITQFVRNTLNKSIGTHDLGKILRYGTISVVSTAISLSGLFVFYRWIGLSPTWSNILATCIATVPYYYLNRRWVFKKSGRSHLTKEVLPFWTIAFVSLVLSTLAVKFAGSQVHSISSKNVRGAILVAANFATYGILWIAKFIVFNRYLFNPDRKTATTP
jgi:putative flippase GtrA